MTADELLAIFSEGFRGRKFTGGLLVAMIDLLVELGVPDIAEVSTYRDLVAAFPRQERTAQGGRANVLILQRPDGTTLSLRPFYNRAERLFQAEHHRYDYPSCAPHATQAWPDYTSWLDTLCALPREDLAKLREQVISFVLAELPDQGFRPGVVKAQPPVFQRLLEGFSFVALPKEPSGAAFQGAVFGFVRADNPHLQVEVDKVRTGSRRRQRVGDIDAWDGERLAITAEVKSFEVTEETLEALAVFANEVGRREAIGLLVSQGFSGKARNAAEAAGLRPLDREDLIHIVSLWDPAKQRIAVESLVYYAAHVEKNSVLLGRLREFLDQAEEAEEV